jgi:hypothetical protein
MSEDSEIQSCKANAKLLWEIHDSLDGNEDTEDTRRLRKAYLILAKHFEYEASRREALTVTTHSQ